MLQLQEINSKYNTSVNFFNYFAIRTILRKFILQFTNGTDFLSDRPNIPFHMQMYTKPLKGGRYLFPILNDCKEGPSDCEQKLNRDHDINFENKFIKSTFLLFTITASYGSNIESSEGFLVHKNF